ncbi:probable glucan 1,3-beta-glucosidase A [Sesamum indicum]|uniref:Probable glucan 1,3-beta-glucosidase A n=1 Tax=Sesamum indicum TaxID=4182 RepID=A0A6I9SV91_SESIN|nr:probable glucan 1,3-beta-glucosidase A [Sesamum indicum]
MKLFIIFSIITCFCQLLSFSNGRSVPNNVGASAPEQVKAVNLGGWLVTEGWIKPSLFDGIINKDLLDGTGVQFQSVKVGKYLSAEGGGGTITVVPTASSSESFRLWRINETTFNFRASTGRFVGLNTTGNGKDIVVEAEEPGAAETFQILRNPNDLNRVRVRAPNGLFLQVKEKDESVSADYEGDGGWKDDDSSVFSIKFGRILQGEYQVTNGYGPLIAPQVMKEHWSTYIVEDDFKFIKENGLNAVRIPVGWWIASDPSPPKPYVPGSLQALDNAFSWAEKYDIKVIIDLHAAPGSQNGAEHSSSRDGSQEWGLTDNNIQQTVGVIEFLAARYANSSSLYAMELINEPMSPGVSLDNLTKYYQAGYDAVRKHSQTAYVVMSNRLGSSFEPTELFSFANRLEGSVIDVHYYPYYNTSLNNVTVERYIEYINNDEAEKVRQLTTSNGPPIFVGEWVAEWQLTNTSKEDYQRYAAAQLEVFGRAQFGWAYWTLKNVNIHWSLEWMINNGYIKL